MPGLTSEQSIGEKTSVCESHCDILENLMSKPFFQGVLQTETSGTSCCYERGCFSYREKLSSVTFIGRRWLGPFCKASILPAIIIIIQKVGLVFEGREHSGIEDARNTARLV